VSGASPELRTHPAGGRGPPARAARAEGERAGARPRAASTRRPGLNGSRRRGLARGTAAELALEIARTLLRTELARGNYDLERLVRETLGEASVGRSPCVVHLHPADHARLADLRFRSGTRLEPDEGVSRGDVHVETPPGLLVRDVDGALDAIASVGARTA
jgi:flagellar biosynthesis/type III secretory pathway protein FliH